MHRRTASFAILFTVIALGLFVRLKSSWFPALVNLYLGDALYAAAMFFAISILFPRQPAARRAITALLICFAIEFSQLYQADWINAVRRTLPGRLLLGSGFLWSDLLAYTLGVVAAVALDRVSLSATSRD